MRIIYINTDSDYAKYARKNLEI